MTAAGSHLRLAPPEAEESNAAGVRVYSCSAVTSEEPWKPWGH